VPDVYATITEADPALVEQLADILELRAADPQQQAMRDEYLAAIPFDGVQVAEIGCGTGAVARNLASRDGIDGVVGVDPSPVLIARARELGGDVEGLRFLEGDARELSLADASLDVVVFHTTLCHVPGPERALAETWRVLRPGGLLAVFDGDYVTTTLSTGLFDPLQACADAVVDFLVHDPFLVRSLLRLARDAGFEVERLRGHSYVEAPTSRGYMLSLAERGADGLATAGRISQSAADALKAEARRRNDEREFFGHIAYASLTARKPA
jgi:SAM-dependent methyltransferase